MKIISLVSLSGGQGKTTLATLLAQSLVRHGFQVLLVDLDPLHDLTTWLGFESQEGQKSLWDVLHQGLSLQDLVYPLSSESSACIIPGHESLRLLESPSGNRFELLRNRFHESLGALPKSLDFCIIDVPPQLIGLNHLAIHCSDLVIIPAEASVKGYSSLIYSLNLLSSQGLGLDEVLAVVPFRDRWVGSKQSQECRIAVESMIEEVGESKVYQSIRESEIFKRAINQRTTPTALGASDLEAPIDALRLAIAPVPPPETPSPKVTKSKKKRRKPAS